MKSKEVRNLTSEDLDTKVVDLRQKLYGLRVQSVTQKIEDNSQIGKTRRDIARLLTERRARQIATQIATQTATHSNADSSQA